MVRTLQFRLGAAAAILIVLALSLAAFGLRAIFTVEIERRAIAELTQISRTVIAQVRLDANGAPDVEVALADPRFQAPYGGLYWQVAKNDTTRARSRSLWDDVLTAPSVPRDGARHTTDIAGPNKTALIAVVQDITVRSASGDVALQVIAALDRSDITAAQQSLFRMLALSLAALGVILVAAMLVFIRLALRPFDKLKAGLQDIHAGNSRSLAGNYPSEVQHVVDDLNQLISFQDAAVEQARARAADLAHALKTPLAVLATVSRQASREGRDDLAEPVDEQIDQMQRHVDRVLARARAGIAATLGNKQTHIAPVIEKILRVFERLPDTGDLTFERKLDPQARFPGEDGDLTEMLGNLLDNARKWGKARIRVSVLRERGDVVLRVEDDGPGLAPDQIGQIARGKRWDESTPGTGFGLAITRDLAEAYNGTLVLERSDLGGLDAMIRIPLPKRLMREA